MEYLKRNKNVILGILGVILLVCVSCCSLKNDKIDTEVLNHQSDQIALKDSTISQLKLQLQECIETSNGLLYDKEIELDCLRNTPIRTITKFKDINLKPVDNVIDLQNTVDSIIKEAQ